jgi:hypothetical protein
MGGAKLKLFTHKNCITNVWDIQCVEHCTCYIIYFFLIIYLASFEMKSVALLNRQPMSKLLFYT